ncbi:MAG: helix-turn-helix domain-containing protein [bacterium]|nr:helix-turn-helix domain-containing protein [bacterium]
MNLFKSNKIETDCEPVAKQLRSRRRAKNLKIKEVAKKLNINEKYLIALEEGKYNQLPRGVYEKNFLREYALFLGLSCDQIAKDYETETSISEPKKPKELFSKQVIKGRHLLIMPKILKNIIIFFIIAACFIYLVYRVNKIISPPLLIIDQPSINLITQETSLVVSGQTEAEANLTINGENVLSDKDGNFSKSINLKNGINKIIITASKKYGRNNTIYREILVKSN